MFCHGLLIAPNSSQGFSERQSYTDGCLGCCSASLLKSEVQDYTITSDSKTYKYNVLIFKPVISRLAWGLPVVPSSLLEGSWGHSEDDTKKPLKCQCLVGCFHHELKRQPASHFKYQSCCHSRANASAEQVQSKHSSTNTQEAMHLVHCSPHCM